MELKINRATVPVADIIFEGIQEQSVELDYILPDYYPDIFRLIRCETVPVITSWNISGERLTYELRCDIRVIYCSEDSNVPQCISQRRSFSKTVELGKACDTPVVKLVPKAEQANCRVVNKRRLDMRGAVSVKISVTGETAQEVICDASGMNIQLRKIPLKFASEKVVVEKSIEISEETELTPAQPAILGIISCRCIVGECEKKMVSGKLLAKGEAEIRLLCSCEKDGTGAVEPMSFTFPYSQIIDIDGIDDSFECTVTPETLGCDVTPVADKDGENRILRCEIELKLVCSAVKSASLMIGTDAYSTVYPCMISSSDVRAEQIPAVFSENFRHTARIAENDAVPQRIYAMWCAPKNINTHMSDDGRSLIVSGMLTYSMAAADASGMIVMPDRDEAFEETIVLGEEVSGCSISAEISVKDVSYYISAEGVLTAKADISAKILAYGCSSVKALTDIAVDNSTKKERDGDYAVKLYYGTENEEIWDIAKRYSTVVDAVLEENELAGDRLENGGMLLIPIVT